MKPVKLALFDFDETLIRENSLATLFKGVTGKRFLFPEVLTLALKTDTYRKGLKFSIKRRLYKRCLAGVNEKTIFSAGETAAASLSPVTAVIEKLVELHDQNYKVWIITAAPTLFVKGVINVWDWPVEQVIGTELYKQGEVYTGGFDKECMQEEKVSKIRAVIAEEKLNVSIEVAYGNLPVDIPMMALALKSYAVKDERISLFKV